jgi:hypothetical protein
MVLGFDREKVARVRESMCQLADLGHQKRFISHLEVK